MSAQVCQYSITTNLNQFVRLIVATVFAAQMLASRRSGFVTFAEVALLRAFGSRFEALSGKDIEVIRDLHMVAPRADTTTDAVNGMPEALPPHVKKEKMRALLFERAGGDDGAGSLSASASDPQAESIVRSPLGSMTPPRMSPAQ